MRDAVDLIKVNMSIRQVDAFGFGMCEHTQLGITSTAKEIPGNTQNLTASMSVNLQWRCRLLSTGCS